MKKDSVRKYRYMSKKLLMVFFLCVAQISSLNAAVTQKMQEDLSLFQVAVSNYLHGDYQKAELVYDSLADSDIYKSTRVPTALNDVALGKKDQALAIFEEVIASGNPRDADYAILWKILLLKTQTDTRPMKTLSDSLVDHIWQRPYEKSIADLYLSKGSVEQVLARVDEIQGNEGLLKTDARTEAIWFIYHWYTSIGNKKAASEIYNKHIHEISEQSLENRLLLDAENSMVK